MEPTAGKGLEGLTIGHFGQFDPDYPRNRTVAKALRRAGAEVVTMSVPGRWHRRTPRLVGRAIRPGLHLDLLLVGFPGHADVAAARALASARRIPLVFDPLVSLTEMAEDRGSLDGARPLAARRLAAEDRWSARLADLVLLDTDTHIEWWAARFDLPRSRFRRVWVGADDEVVQPGPRPAAAGADADGAAAGAALERRVLFAGTFIPLHGVEHIVRAAAQVALTDGNVRFDLIGSGQTLAQARALAADLAVTNVAFLPRVSHADLAAAMAASDICLGIFGTTAKAGRVIPNKAFDALAAARPLVTADTPAAREALVHGQHAWLVPAGDPHALAGAVLHLLDDRPLRDTLARRGHDLFEREFSLDALSRRLASVLGEVLGP